MRKNCFVFLLPKRFPFNTVAEGNSTHETDSPTPPVFPIVFLISKLHSHFLRIYTPSPPPHKLNSTSHLINPWGKIWGKKLENDFTWVCNDDKIVGWQTKRKLVVGTHTKNCSTFKHLQRNVYWKPVLAYIANMYSSTPL